MPAGTEFGRVTTGHWPVRMVGPAGNEVTEEFFEVSEGALRLCRSLMPSLLTLDPRIVRQDCLCDLMEALKRPAIV